MRKLIHITCVVMLFIAVTACDGGAENTPTTTASPSDTAPTETTEATTEATATTVADTEPEQVVIGLITSESGAFTEFGLPWRDSAQLAVNQINEAGGVMVDGVEYQLVLEVRDDRSEPEVGVAAATELIEEEGAGFLIAPLISGITPPVVDYAMTQGVLTLSGASVLDGVLSEESASGDYSLLFKTQIEGTSRGLMTMDGITALLPDVTRGATLVPAHAGGQSIAASAAAAAPAYDQELVVQEEFPPGSTDFSTALTLMSGADAQYVIMCCGAADHSAIVSQALQFDAVDAFVGATYSMSIPLEEAIGEPIPLPSVHTGLPAIHEALPDGSIFTYGDPMGEYADAYEAEFNAPPGAASSNGLFIYDFVFMLAEAMSQAGTLDASAVSEALEGLSYDGAIGTITFGPDHIARHPIQSCLVESGEVAQCVDTSWIPGE